MPKKTNKQDKKKQTNEVGDLIEKLMTQLEQAQDKEKRAVADYQNLVRRNQEDRTKLFEMASLGLIEDLIEPLEHLSMASQQLDDQGLNMVVEKLWQVLGQHGLEEFDPQDQNFNVESMEAVETDRPKGEPAKGGEILNKKTKNVVEVRSKGYKLNGKVIKFAKVVVG